MTRYHPRVPDYSIVYQAGAVVEVVTLVQSRLEDATELMADVLLLLIRSTQLNFDAQGRPDQWADLAPSTTRARFAKGMKGRGAKAKGSLAVLGSIQILRDTGLLMQSLGEGRSGSFETADGFGESDKFTATLGTNRPGADALQTGVPERNLPAREYVLFQAQDYDDIGQMHEDFVLGLGPYSVA